MRWGAFYSRSVLSYFRLAPTLDTAWFRGRASCAICIVGFEKQENVVPGTEHALIICTGSWIEGGAGGPARNRGLNPTRRTKPTGRRDAYQRSSGTGRWVAQYLQPTAYHSPNTMSAISSPS